MTEPSPNERQQDLIEGTEGLYLADAGPGTGKTFTVTRRYANILSQEGVEPGDVLLVTFTRNAAGEMRERIVARTDYDLAQLQDAPIDTFHAYCYRLLRRYGHRAPELLGIDDRVPQSLDLVEDEVREREQFRAFVAAFEDRHPEYADVFATLRDPTGLRELVAELAAKGVIPTADGWYRDGEQLLRGDRETFREMLAAANEPNEGANGPIQSDARSGVTGRLDREMAPYHPDAPAFDDVVDYPGVDEAAVLAAFDEDRDRLVKFVRALYHEYLAFALERNFLTQGLMLALSYVMLVEDDAVRERVAHEYVMVDEFQDTNELQFKLTLLLAGRPNICVVGDWKQSIYGFQYTSIENITAFRERLERYHAALNDDRERLDYEVDADAVETVTLEQNYRATQSLIDRSTAALTTSATGGEDVDVGDLPAELPELVSTSHVDDSVIAAHSHADELDLVLDRIQHIVGNPDYAVEKHDEPTVGEDASDEEKLAAERERLEPPSYEDIAVFTRVHSFARDLLERARAHAIPVGYQGGVELFDTDQAKLLLAWLRIVEHDDDRGWAVVLEEAGYTLPAAEQRLEDSDYPDVMVAFREELRETETLGGLAQRVFARYGYEGAYADALVDELTGLYDGTVYARGEAIAMLEANLEAGTAPEVDTSPGADAVTLQTIHGAKGLEYPIVILANVNQGAFPHYGRPSTSRIRYDDTLGVRQTHVHDDPTGQPHVFDRWQYDVLSGVLPSEYDEERRLLYVAMTRAKRHLLVTAGEEPSPFFAELPIEATAVESTVTEGPGRDVDTAPLAVGVPTQAGPIRTGVHDIMDDSVYEEVTEGMGKEFGDAVHDFAEAYVDGANPAPEGEAAVEQRQVARYIDGFDGVLSAEQTVLCPLEGEPRIVLTGIIDLLHVAAGRVDIVDYKTDRTRVAHEEYRKQLSVYYHVLRAEYPDRAIRPTVYYTADDEAVVVDPLEMASLRTAAEEMLLAE